MKYIFKNTLLMLATLSVCQAMDDQIVPEPSPPKVFLHFENDSPQSVKLYIENYIQNKNSKNELLELVCDSTPLVRKNSTYEFTTADLTSEIKDNYNKALSLHFITKIHVMLPGSIDEKFIKWDTSKDGNSIKLTAHYQLTPLN